MNRFIGCAALLSSFLISTFTHAELLDDSLVNANGAINAPGGTIAKSLQEQIGSGHGDVNIPGSAVYLIKRDPARSIRRGRQLFQRKFSAAEGLGPRVNFDSSGDVTQTRALGAGFADSCGACHGRPKGSAGFGGDVATRPDSRDAPHLFGLGIIEQLADEMTQELRAIRSAAVQQAQLQNQNITLPLTAKGISFGSLTALPNGTIDTSAVEGVNSNLRVRPFFHEGGTASMREFIIGAFNAEMGLQAYDPILCAVTDPTTPIAATSPAGFTYDPELDEFERPPVCSETADADNDGVNNEIDTALIDHLEFYLLNYFKPGQYEVTQRAESGLRIMDSIGCTQCHVQNLTIDEDRRVADVETVYDPANGIFNDLFATASTQFFIHDDGNEFPQLLPNKNSFIVKNIFSDLKRHDLGPAFHERDYDGTLQTEFVTEPLWGVGSTSPYGHDGRSINLDQAIKRHGGEAESVTQAYIALNDNRRRMVLEFLQTLVLFPPDDTASNLNPGNPNTNNPQSPAEHGNIFLPALFQIPSEGAE